MSTTQPSLLHEVRTRINLRLLPLYWFLLLLTGVVAITFIGVMYLLYQQDPVPGGMEGVNLFAELLLWAALLLALQADKILAGSLAYAYKKYRTRGDSE